MKSKSEDIVRVKKHFQDAFNDRKTLSSLTKYADVKRMISNNYMVCSYGALLVLIEKMKQRVECRFELRYVVDETGTIWFSLEGAPGDDVDYLTPVDTNGVGEQSPAHSDMLPKHIAVIASGIVVFSEAYQITKITNFSGHYRPHANTLLWPLAALLNCDADFTAEVTLSFFWKKDYAKRKYKTVTIPKNELHTLLPEGCTVNVVSNPAYEVRVYTKQACETFGPGQTPQFKKKEKQPSLVPSTQFGFANDFYSRFVQSSDSLNKRRKMSVNDTGSPTMFSSSSSSKSVASSLQFKTGASSSNASSAMSGYDADAEQNKNRSPSDINRYTFKSLSLTPKSSPIHMSLQQPVSSSSSFQPVINSSIPNSATPPPSPKMLTISSPFSDCDSDSDNDMQTMKK